MKPARVGVIGRGFGANVHAPAFGSLPGVEAVSIAGSVDWYDIIHNKQIDIISIATPPATHCALVCEALDAGKHVLCEKPFGTNTGEAYLMWDAARAARILTTGIGFQFRMETGVNALKQSIDAGRIGTVQRIEVAWLFNSPSGAPQKASWKDDDRVGGGLINAIASHVVDYLEWISGQRITSVTARCEALCEIDVEMTSGVRAAVKLSNAYSPALGHRIEVDGDRGRATYFHAAPFEGVQPELRFEIQDGPPQIILAAVPSGADSRLGAFRKLASVFLDKIWGNDAPDLPDFTTGLRVRTVLDAIQESIRLDADVTVVAK